MLPLPPTSTLTDTLFPYPTLFRSAAGEHALCRKPAAHAPAVPREARGPERCATDGAAGRGGQPCQRPRPAGHGGRAAVPHPAPGLLGRRRRAPLRRAGPALLLPGAAYLRSEEHTSELQSLMRISYAVFCLKKKK